MTTGQSGSGQDHLLQFALKEFTDCVDLVHWSYPRIHVDILFFGHLVGTFEMNRDVVTPLSQADEGLIPVQALLSRSQYVETSEHKAVIEAIMDGCAAIFHENRAYMINVYRPESRSVEKSDTETVITGPHDAFVETAGINLSLIRRKVKSSHLKTIKLEVGEVTKTLVYVLYIQDVVNMDFVTEMVERIRNIEVDSVFDGNMLIQYIDDEPHSVFPQFMTTERVDSSVSKLVGGRVLAIVDGSPSVIAAPVAFFEFFSSPDDYYQRWAIGTATRLLRLLALIVTVGFTALYVSVTTYHYEMIPEALLLTLTESRSRVPFPPIYEALLMELMIEMLREAGARLPSKIGQTIGIVGGIVIGTAAVQAGFTSNILIIAVASSAIASFVIPSYVMSASIRLIRFGLIVLAGMWGNLGIVIGLVLIIIHLSGLTSLKAPYIYPIAPNKPGDWTDIFIRAPFSMLTKRPSLVRTPNKVRTRMRK